MADVAELKALAETLKAFGAVELEPGPAYEVDGIGPQIAVRPRTQQDVAAALKACSEAGAAVVPRGAGTQMALGMPPERYEVALDLSELERVFEHESADLTVTVDAAHGWEAMQTALSQHGQWVPLEAPEGRTLEDGGHPQTSAKEARGATVGGVLAPTSEDGGDPQTPTEGTRQAAGPTVGGMLATNASGPARLRYGTARDLVIGMTVALASGEIVKSGGRVVKNVAGYDMAKLHIGALGTLGVILQASFKVSPLAESRPYAGARGALPAVSKLADGVLAARLPLLGLELVKARGEPTWVLLARFGGGATAVERAASEFEAMAAGGGCQVFRPEQVVHVSGSQAGVRASVPPIKTVEMAEAIAGAGAAVSAYPGVGAVQGSWAEAPEADVVTELRRRAVAAGGALVLAKGPVELKRAVGVWGETRGDFALMQRLKQQFDASRTLNPGRFVGGI